MAARPSLAERSQLHPLAGSFVTAADPAIAEAMGEAGFDFLVVDVEHTGMALLTAQSVMQGIGNTDTSALVRVGELSEAQIKQALDAGADGVIVPHIRSAADAARLVEYAKYPPLGHRGLAAARAARYGVAFDEYSATANSRTSAIPMIEDVEALSESADIAATDGIDFVFIGPWDLAASMGHLGNPRADDVVAAAESIIDTTKASGKKCLIFAANGADARGWIDRGADGVAIGLDYTLLLEQCRDQLTAMGR
jgi:2-keto-3-deoxy-L-rhamnonate aldolase RhmA